MLLSVLLHRQEEGNTGEMKRHPSALEMAIEADAEADRQHAAELEMHREISNLRAQLTDARSKLAGAGIHLPEPAPPEPTTPEGAAAAAADAASLQPEPPAEESGGAPEEPQPGTTREGERRQEQQQRATSGGGGLWGYITGADSSEDLT